MARNEARIFSTIWQDTDFRELAPSPQRLYFFLLSQPDLSFCGVIPLRAGKWARSAKNLIAADVLEDLKALEEVTPRPFIVFDEETEEVFVRSLIRRDEIWKQPNIMKAARKAAALIESPKIREALLAELLRIPIEESDSRLARSVLEGFVEDLGGTPAFPSANPSGKGSGNPSPNPSANPSANPCQGKGEGYGEQVRDSPNPVIPFPNPPAAGGDDSHPDETPNQRANRLAKVYTDRVKPSNHPAVAKIVRKAVDANCSDELITKGLLALVAESRSCTTDALRIAMYGRSRAAPVAANGTGAHIDFNAPFPQTLDEL